MYDLLSSDCEVVASDHTADIRDSAQLLDLIRRSTPDFVVNFASITTVRESFEAPDKTYQIGFLGTLNLLQCLKATAFKGRMLNISSSEVYGFPQSNQLPLRETSGFNPMNPYSVNKVATEALCYQWSQTEKFEIITARPFTHIGPRQSERFAISNFAKQIAEILLKKKDPLVEVGDLDTTRDLTDVRDVVRAYRLLLEKGRNGEVYNVCSGREVSMRSLLDNLVKLAGIAVTIRQDERLLRRFDQSRTLGSFEKIRDETGWTPSIPFDRTLRDTVEFWKLQIQDNKSGSQKGGSPCI
jgi:GDP-4-dehydro-6-deoxy-D-mannose reductase